ncbi:MAG: hypothetical protein Q4C40_03685 [Eubacteriales bacterium]|nr:hypothetical protein [Eubacteriales bacterium]
MKKRLLAMIMALGILCSSAVCSYAVDADDTSNGSETENPEVTVLWPGIMPLGDLYDDSNISTSSGSTRTDTFTATSGNGGIIRVWYRNDASISAKVILYKYDSGTKKYKNAINFTVDSGKGKWKEYKGVGASTGKYYITIEAIGGKNVKGYLRAIQTTQSLS